jgi:hypothetical protein
LIALAIVIAPAPALAGDSSEAARAFDEACGSTNGQCVSALGREALWLRAATMYEALVASNATASEAGGLALRAAFSAKNANDRDRATRDLEQLTKSTYAADATLQRLEQTDKREYDARRNLLANVYDELGTDAFASFSYERAAETYDAELARPYLPRQKRQEAGRNAAIMHRALGHGAKLVAAVDTTKKLGSTAEEIASLDYLVAEYEHARHGDRHVAIAALSAFYNTYARTPPGAKYALEAAWFVAEMKREAGEPFLDWYAKVDNAWGYYATGPSNVAHKLPYVEYGAKAAIAVLQDEIAKSIVPPHTCSVGATFSMLSKKADELDARLAQLAVKYEGVTTDPQRAALFDVLRQHLRSSCISAAGTAIRSQIATELASVDEAIIRRAARAIAVAAGGYEVSDLEATRTRFVSVRMEIGDDKTRTIISTLRNPLDLAHGLEIREEQLAHHAIHPSNEGTIAFMPVR